MALSKLSTTLNKISTLATKIRGQASTVKAAFDYDVNVVKDFINNTLTAEIDTLDAANVKKTGAQSIDGVKTFTSSPIVPIATGNTEAVQKVYVDDKDTVQTGALNTHKTSSDHDGRYYTETELDNGQLDNRYYTETEVNNGFSTKTETVKNTGNETIAGIKTFSSSPVVPTPTTSTQASNKGYVDTVASNFVLGAIPDGSLGISKLNFDPATQSELDSVSLVANSAQTTANAAATQTNFNSHLADTTAHGYGTKILNEQRIYSMGGMI